MLKISVKYFLLILIISNVLSCNRNHTPEGIAVVDINPNQEASTKKLSELISSIDYVLLKSGNSSFLANINDAIFFKNNYYVLDKFQNSIVKFDETGNYVDKFRFVGNGPGEYNKIDFFDINRKLETFEIYDVRKGTIFRYDLFGNFQKALRVTLICRDFKITEEGNYLFYSPDEQNNFNNTLSLKPGVIHVSGDGSFAKPILSLGDSNFPPLLASRSFVNFDKEIYLFSNYSDTVFQISDDKITNRYLMDYGVGNRVEENNITSSNFNFGNTDFPFLKLNPMVTDKFIGYTFMYRGKDKSLLIDRSNLKAEIYRGIINDIDSGFFVLNGSTINKNIYVSYLTSEMADAYSQYLYKEKSGKPDSSSYRLSALIEQMKMNNENPILVKGNLK